MTTISRVAPRFGALIVDPQTRHVDPETATELERLGKDTFKPTLDRLDSQGIDIRVSFFQSRHTQAKRGIVTLCNKAGESLLSRPNEDFRLSSHSAFLFAKDLFSYAFQDAIEVLTERFEAKK